MRADRCGDTCGQKCRAKGSRKEAKIQQFMCRNTANVDHAMCECTGDMWGHRNSNERFKDPFGSQSGETYSRSSTKDSCIWNITHNSESAELQAETGRLRLADRRWLRRGSAREKRRVSRDDDDDNNNNNIIILYNNNNNNNNNNNKRT